MVDVLILLGVVACIVLLLAVLESLDERSQVQADAVRTINALRAARELRRDAWQTRQQMRSYVDAVIDRDADERNRR